MEIQFTDAPFGDILNPPEEDFGDDLSEKLWAPWVYDCASPKFSPGMDYLLKRGIGLDIIQKYQIRYDAQDKRVMFPVIVDGLLLGWQGRYIKPTEVLNPKGDVVYTVPKILTSEGLSGGKYLMFQDNLLTSDTAFLAEGPFDALKADTLGIANIASMGKSVSIHQIDTLLLYPIKKLYLGLDRDAANEMSRLVREIGGQSSIDIYSVEPPKHREDFGACTFDEVREAYDKAEKVDSTHIFIYFKRDK